MAKNKSLYSTPAEGVTLRPGTSKVLTQTEHHHHHHNPGIDVSEYAALRLFATNRSTSVSYVYIALLSTQDGQTSFKLGKVKLAPGQSYTNTYAVPGDYVNIKAYAAKKSGSCLGGTDVIDVQLYGHK
ncbi:hypothetical protein ACX1C1_13390 [Paenibacillus sp. strain BS8-2]